ncbi:MAG: hypothetical protein LBV73_27470 [Paraburkholderia sp.]|jgi:hypothetical protein|nr:hypothetical protein [Paraburkholderia sp.]
MRYYSTSCMIERLAGLIGTGDLSNWEESFVRNLDEIRLAGEVTKLTDSQIEKLDELHAKHFA